ncbi:hypothetical protein Cs308_0426 [Candidatus Chlamydia sanziniae]|uniref:Autotransporter domain-containing protein n=2 Tax=Candidatus Chlamydia sanziniae TaxID=1806891 RepID=A0A1A9HV72_9CHLA|nr:hypothetical protein Cs308_0426 [Candidatus Chlamydia sanziniae]
MFWVATMPTAFANILLDIGEPGLSSQALGVSGDGSVVVGVESGEIVRAIPFKYEDGKRIVLSTLKPEKTTFVTGVSEDGSIIVGMSSIGSGMYHAVKWDNDVLIDLGTLSTGVDSEAQAISADGRVIVGNASEELGITVAVKWENDAIAVLPYAEGGAQSFANAVSGDGSIIVGTSITPEWLSSAVKWEKDTATFLGTLGGNVAIAVGISKDGKTIIGSSETDRAEVHGYAYTNGTMQDLGTLGGIYSLAKGISADGKVIVGEATISTHQRHAFQYVNGTMIDLGTLGGEESSANAISTDGKIIVGRAQTAGGEWHAFICPTQVKDTTSTVVDSDSSIHSRQARSTMVDVENTYVSLRHQRKALASSLNQQSTILQNALDSGSLESRHGSSIVAPLLHGNYSRLNTLNFSLFGGAFLNQRCQAVNNFYLKQNNAWTGAFLGWQASQASKASLRFSFGYGCQDVVLTREQLSYTEKGLGNSSFTSMGGQFEGRYNVALKEDVAIQSCVGLRLMSISRLGYTENDVFLPVHYDNFAYSAVTGFAGTCLKALVMPNMAMSFTMGIEQDFASHVDDFSGSMKVLGRFTFQNREHSMRPFGSLVLNYNLPKHQQLKTTFLMNQQPLNGGTNLVSNGSYCINF